MTFKYPLLLVALMILVVSASGLRVTFQQPEDFIAQTSCYTPSGAPACTWVENTTGGNSYFYAYVMSQTALPMTYAAATHLDSGMWGLDLLDASGNFMYRMDYAASGTPNRIEMKMIGGQANIYRDSTFVEKSGILAVNPSYVIFISQYWDDIIWGDTESKYIFGMPDQGYYTGKQYFLMKDMLNPASSGFYRRNTTNQTGAPTLIASYTFPSTFGKATTDDEILCLEDYGGACYDTVQTGTAMAGTHNWNLTKFFTSTAPYGLYDTTIQEQVPSSAPYVVSERIPYIGSGATIDFDKNSYAVGESAVATVIVSDGYYNLATYSYHVVIQDIYGVEVSDQPITFSPSPRTGTVSYTWSDTDDEGVYYGLIYATRLSDSEELLMNYDVCDLSSNVVFEGFVKDATTTTGLSGATVNLSQGVNVNTVTSGTDGNYTTSGTYVFVADAPTTISASLAGYVTHSYTFTPLIGGVFDVNISLIPIFPTYTGVALGGIVTKPPFGQTVDNALVTVTNGTTVYTATTNSAGYYQIDSMLASKTYGIFGSKTGFSNSTVYSLLVTGT